MANTAPKFEWDYDVPKTAFWESLDYTLGRSFLQCYTNDEIAGMKLDESLSIDGKLVFLLKTLDSTLAIKERRSRTEKGLPLKDTEYVVWRTILLGLSTIEHFLGNLAMEETLARERYENGPDGTKDMSALQELSIVAQARGDYNEGEKMAKQVLKWLDGHEILGKDSPQAISSACVLATCIWKQKRYGEGYEWLAECTRRVQSMGSSKFAKYQQAEERQVEETRGALESWKKDQENE